MVLHTYTLPLLLALCKELDALLRPEGLGRVPNDRPGEVREVVAVPRVLLRVAEREGRRFLKRERCLVYIRS